MENITESKAFAKWQSLLNDEENSVQIGNGNTYSVLSASYEDYADGTKHDKSLVKAKIVK